MQSDFGYSNRRVNRCWFLTQSYNIQTAEILQKKSRVTWSELFINLSSDPNPISGSFFYLFQRSIGNFRHLKSYCVYLEI